MIRKIIQIDENKCNGCGLCAKACHEGAIGMVAGKARLLRDDYCDGLGDCLPACPMTSRPYSRTKPNSSHPAAARAVRPACCTPQGRKCSPQPPLALLS